MADFNDSVDPELGAACNRLAAFCEALPADMVIDPRSGLAESDLVTILRRLHATRLIQHPSADRPMSGERMPGQAGVPLTARK